MPNLEQEAALREWKHLCYTLERAQGDHFVAICRDKYQFAKTYLVYGREMDQVGVEVRQAGKQGNFAFFTERGMPGRLMMPALADEMLKAWRIAVASKRARIAEMFQRRFGEDIEEFLGTPHNASRLVMAVGIDQRDAVLALADRTQEKLLAIELVQLRCDLAILKEVAQRLANLVAVWLSES